MAHKWLLKATPLICRLCHPSLHSGVEAGTFRIAKISLKSQLYFHAKTKHSFRKEGVAREKKSISSISPYNPFQTLLLSLKVKKP